MNSLHRLLALAAVCLIALTACKPSAEKSSASAPIDASTGKPVAAQTAPTNTLQLSPSGEYSVLATPQPAEKGSKVEVLEFFAYFCPHCKTFDPAVSAWAKKNADKVIFRRVPVAFKEDMIPQQRMYYALEAMGKLEGLHEKSFHAVQEERRALSSEAEILEFVAQHGVDKAKFKELYDSFGVQSQARSAFNMQSSYAIQSVPNIAVDGRYMTSASHAQKRPGVQESEAGLQTATLQIMDDLVAKVLKDRQTAKK